MLSAGQEMRAQVLDKAPGRERTAVAFQLRVADCYVVALVS